MAVRNVPDPKMDEAQYCLCDEIKKNEMCGARDMYEGGLGAYWLFGGETVDKKATWKKYVETGGL